jgi:2-methylisocitrate lyase-like PEP mutase family enzyme
MSRTSIFRDLHGNGPILILPNVWDAGGARIVESLGAKAIATTSAGVAWAKGYRDGNAMPFGLQAQLAEEIVRAVRIPVTIDFEAGYSDDAATVAENLRPLVEAGISGINLEDGAESPYLLARKIEAIKAMALAAGADIFINARTDVYLRGLGGEGESVGETLSRAATYQAAGADGLFVPGLTDPEEIGAIVKGTALPVNVMARPNLPKAKELEKLGVRRLSAGSGIAQVAYQHVAQTAGAFLSEGDFSPLGKDSRSYSDLQELFRGA